ncbi:unnamed protein product, partial [Rotaria sp. Silwood2]
MNEQVSILEHRLTSKQLPPASTVLDHIIDNIDTILAKSNDIIKEHTSSNSLSVQLESMNQFKHDITQQ